jgi:DNA-binding FadR family transcriptional regulator
MERMGLVSRIEEQLERMISLEQLPADGSFPSEQMLARRYGVSRATLREALLRLAARGLVVQHPGRKTRAVALDEAVTLENLGIALHGDASSHPERRRLLDGFFSLKRDVTVELLAACCEHASAPELARLEEACFVLADTARWKQDRREWVQQEFALLRLAAHVANRPGHFLLIQSLERSFWGMAARLLPHLDPEALHPWALCALHALGERDTQMVRRELLPLLQACDERVLGSLAPVSHAADMPEASRTAMETYPEESPEPEPMTRALPEAASTNLSDSQTGLSDGSPEAAVPHGVRACPPREDERCDEPTDQDDAGLAPSPRAQNLAPEPEARVIRPFDGLPACPHDPRHPSGELGAPVAGAAPVPRSG